MPEDTAPAPLSDVELQALTLSHSRYANILGIVAHEAVDCLDDILDYIHAVEKAPPALDLRRFANPSFGSYGELYQMTTPLPLFANGIGNTPRDAILRWAVDWRRRKAKWESNDTGGKKDESPVST